MQPFKTIVIGIAFSPTLRANVAEGTRLASFFKGRLILVHVGEKTAEKEQTINAIIKEFGVENQSIELLWMPGKPVSVILQACAENNAELLILGAQQREKFVKYYLGSIARKITRQATCSVLLLINPSEKRVPSKHIVVNGLEDPKTKDAVNCSFYVAKALGTNQLTIVEEIKQSEVQVTVSDDRTLRKAALVKERIKQREKSRMNLILKEVPEALKTRVSIKIQSIFGRRGYSIGHYARVVRADLLIMNAPSKTSFFDRLFPRDIEYILSELPTDVLIIQQALSNGSKRK